MGDRWERAKEGGLELHRRRLPRLRAKLVFIAALGIVSFLVLWLALEVGWLGAAFRPLQ